MRFLADESCDFAVVIALREAGHDVTAVAEISPGVADEVVLAFARNEARALLTEDKDFDRVAYAGGHETAGIILIQFPAGVRSTLGQALVDAVAELADRIGASCRRNPDSADFSANLRTAPEWTPRQSGVYSSRDGLSAADERPHRSPKRPYRRSS